MTKSLLRYGFWIGAVAALWFIFAPTQIGGYDSYVITDGTSMLPTIHGGGLVVTRSESSYHVGEIAAYHNQQLAGAVVLHRIIKIDDDHYTFKGDNNRYADLDPPTKSVIVGRRWIYWPSGGRFIENLETPWVGAIVFAILGMWAFSDIGSSSSRKKHRLRHRHTAASS